MAPAKGGRKLSRRLKTFLWVAAVSAIVIVLLYLERADVLYILSTVGVAVLLIMVAMADLSGSKKDPGPIDELNTAK